MGFNSGFKGLKTPLPIEYDAGRASEPVWTAGKNLLHRDSIPKPSSP